MDYLQSKEEFISAYTETLKQKKVLTPRQKDILDTEKETLNFPFDRNTAIEQIIQRLNK